MKQLMVRNGGGIFGLGNLVTRSGLVFLLLVLLGVSGITREIEAYFSPYGGFDAQNNTRRIVLPDGRKVLPTMNNSVLDLVLRVPKDGEIKLAMYNFSDEEIQGQLIDAALNRNVRVKVILDGVADWTKESIDKFVAMVKDKAAGNPGFDFQIKVIRKDAMVKHERIRKLNENELIYGTMHEKFGIVYGKDRKTPVHCFAGSSNLSAFSDQVFSENRIVFRDSPIISAIFAQEFARLWNHFGTATVGSCPDEEFVKVQGDAGLRVIFNGAKYNIEDNRRIDNEILRTMDSVDPEHGTLDIAMFSFTHWDIAQKILEIAGKYPKVRIRIMLDQSQLEGGGDRKGLMSVYLEKKILEKKLKNISMRYKWRANAYGMDEESKTIGLVHFRSHLLHHKFVIVDKKILLTGSYNWSQSAEFRNLENLMIFRNEEKGHGDIIRRFLAEFDYLWGSDKLTIIGKSGIEASRNIRKSLAKPFNLKLRDYIDKEKEPLLMKAYQDLGVKMTVLMKGVRELEKAGVIHTEKIKGGLKLSLAD